MASVKVVAVLILACWLIATPRSASAEAVEKGNLGLGLIVGEPTGVSAKLYLSDTTAVSGAAGFAFVGGGLHLHADYLLHPWILTKEKKFVMPAFVGIGGRLFSHNRGRGSDSDDLHLGLRVVGGLLFDFTEVSMDAFIEVAGIIEHRTAGDDHGGFGKFSINAGAGVRYYF